MVEPQQKSNAKSRKTSSCTIDSFFIENRDFLGGRLNQLVVGRVCRSTHRCWPSGCDRGEPGGNLTEKKKNKHGKEEIIKTGNI